MKNNWLVYKHTSPSGKVYIGITCRKVYKRWGAGSGYKTQILFYRAILKYGWENIKHEILFSNLTKNEADSIEISLIKYYKKLGISYNITNGGEGITGYKFSEESRKKMRLSHLGQKIRHSKNTIQKCRENQPNKRPVSQYSLNGEHLIDFQSIGEANRKTGIQKQNIFKCCNGQRHSAGGYKWKYNI